MANSFDPKESPIPLKSKTAPEPDPAQASVPAGGLKLPTAKPMRKQCSMYLDVEMMDAVRKIAQRNGWTISDLVEAFVKAGLEQME